MVVGAIGSITLYPAASVSGDESLRLKATDGTGNAGYQGDDFPTRASMAPIIVTGSAHRSLSDAVAERLGVRVCRSALRRFPDSELHAEIGESVRAGDVYLIQPT